MKKCIEGKKIEIFCGTGGVGKTTLATSRALHLSRKNKKVLLITIDPSRRLKEVLNIDDSRAGELVEICHIQDTPKFTALLMSPRATMDRVATENGIKDIFENRIIKILSRPNGGLNEILSIVELEYHLKNDSFDCIILDTPPGQHFIEFLHSCSKIEKFFDRSFIEVFKFFGKKLARPNVTPAKKIVNLILSTGLKKLLSYLGRVTGEKFVEEFVEAVSMIHMARNTFLSAIKLKNELEKREKTNWFLVTSVEHNKIEEALSLSRKAKEIMHDDNYLAINRCLSNLWDKYTDNSSQILSDLKESQIDREKRIFESTKNEFGNLLKFSDVLKDSPLEHIFALAKMW